MMLEATVLPLSSSALSTIFIAVIVALVVVSFLVRARRSGIKAALKKKSPPGA
jgi:hypothetical protein